MFNQENIYKSVGAKIRKIQVYGSQPSDQIKLPITSAPIEPKIISAAELCKKRNLYIKKRGPHTITNMPKYFTGWKLSIYLYQFQISFNFLSINPILSRLTI